LEIQQQQKQNKCIYEEEEEEEINSYLAASIPWTLGSANDELGKVV
jgi:hypothetical protein